MIIRRDIIIRKAFALLWKECDPNNGELVTADYFERNAYKDPNLDIWLQKAEIEYTKEVTDRINQGNL